jgi:hypothetical protein
MNSTNSFRHSCCGFSPSDFIGVKSKPSALRPLPYSKIVQAVERSAGQISRFKCQELLPRDVVRRLVVQGSFDELHELIHKTAAAVSTGQSEQLKDQPHDFIPIEEVNEVSTAAARLSAHYLKMTGAPPTNPFYETIADILPSSSEGEFIHRMQFVKSVIPAARGRVSSSTQTIASSFKSDISTQIYLPKSSEANTGKTRSVQCETDLNGSAFSGEGKVKRYLYGLRGAASFRDLRLVI